MKFNTAIDTIVFGMDEEKWRNRYDAKDYYIFMGCEGRFMRRATWSSGLYITNSIIFDRPKYVKSPVENIVLCDFSQYPIAYPVLKVEDVEANDWEVWDFIPNGKAKVDLENGLYGFWSKFEHKFARDSEGVVQEIDELLPYWDKKEKKYIKLNKAVESHFIDSLRKDIRF